MRKDITFDRNKKQMLLEYKITIVTLKIINQRKMTVNLIHDICV